MSEHAQLPNLRARVDDLERTLRDIRKTAADAQEKSSHKDTLTWICEEVDSVLEDA